MIRGRAIVVTKAPWPNQTPTRSGRVARICPAISSSADGQSISRHAPLPRAPARRSGTRSRRSLCGISIAACPRTQRKPRLSGLSGSPSTRRARPSAPTSTSIPQYVGWQFIGHIVRTRSGGMPTSSRRRGSAQVYAAAPPVAAPGVGAGGRPRAQPPAAVGETPGLARTAGDAAAGTQRPA